MSVTVQTQANTNFVEVTLNGKITRQDYERFQPIIDEEIKKHGRICMLVVAKEFNGWDLGASWEETRFIFSHYSKIDRIGLVGAAEWQKWMTFFCKPFTSAEVKFFEPSEESQARQWVTSAEIIFVNPNSNKTPDANQSNESVSGASCSSASDTLAFKTESGKSCQDSCSKPEHKSKTPGEACASGKENTKSNPVENEIQEEGFVYSELSSDEPLLEDEDEEEYRSGRYKNREEELVGAK